MNKEKTINSLNKLVETNNDRIEGYEKASENTEEKELKSLFLKFIQTSTECLEDLENAIDSLGGNVNTEASVSGNFFRYWPGVKFALAGKDRKVILGLCEYGEEQAIEAYKVVMYDRKEHLSPQHQLMIKEQYQLLKSDLNIINSMNNTLVEAFFRY